MTSFFGELKRRNVVKVAVAYAIVGWLLVEVSSTVLPTFEAPQWVLQTITFVVILGFPLALILSWAFDLTAEGLVRDKGTNVAAPGSGRRIEYVFTGLLVVAVATLLYREFSPTEQVVEVVAEGAQREFLPNSIAVLPFENLNPGSEDEWFASGLHDELLNQLTKVQDLNVIARTSVLRYIDSDMSIPEVAEELKVETIMEGTVRYAEDSVRVTIQLIDAATEANLWSETYTRPFANIFEIETDIATQVASALEAEFSLAEQEIIASAPSPNSPEAFALYVRAIDLWQSTGPTPDVLARVQDDLNRTIALDPEFAQPHAVLADIYAERLFADIGTPENWMTRRVELVGLAVEHAERALELDPNLGYAYAALGKVHLQHRRETDARAAFERALQLSPSDPEVLIENAWFNSYAGRHEDAVAFGERAVELDPGNGDLLMRLGVNYFMARKYDSSLLAYRQAISVEPTNAMAYLFLGSVEAWQRNYAEAVDTLRLAEQLYGDVQSGFLLGHLAYHYGLAMSPDDASRAFERLENVAGEHRVGGISWALAYLGIGDQERALEQLNWVAENKLPDEGVFFYGFFVNNLWNDPILDQPEFEEVRSRLGFRE